MFDPWNGIRGGETRAGRSRKGRSRPRWSVSPGWKTPIYEELQGALALLEAQMEPLRAAGKQKSARFRELMGERLLLRRMLELLERHGLS